MFSEIVLVTGKVHQFCCAFLEKTVLFQKNIRKGFQRKSYSIHSDEKHLLFRAFGQYRCATSSLVKFYLGIRLVFQKKSDFHDNPTENSILQTIKFFRSYHNGRFSCCSPYRSLFFWWKAKDIFLRKDRNWFNEMVFVAQPSVKWK